MVLEGVALSHKEFLPVQSSTNPDRSRDISRFGEGATDIMDILQEIKEFRQKEFSKNNPAWKDETTICKNYPDYFLDRVDRIKLPEFFVLQQEDKTQVMKLINWVLDMAAVVYLQSDYVNDFYLLHGITGKEASINDTYLIMFP